MFNKINHRNNEKSLGHISKKLVTSIDANISSAQNNIDSAIEVLTNFKKNKYSKHDSFFNLCIFSDIVNIDLSILLEKISLAKRTQEKKLFARVIALTIVDYLDNINVLLGKDCLLELKNNNMTEFSEEFKEIHKKFSIFRKSNDRLLRDIRNSTIAHKSKDAVKLNEQINKLNEDEIFDFGLELKEYSKEFIDISTKIIYYIVGYMKEGRSI